VMENGPDEEYHQALIFATLALSRARAPQPPDACLP
jgi:hypothetical protein